MNKFKIFSTSCSSLSVSLSLFFVPGQHYTCIWPYTLKIEARIHLPAVCCHIQEDSLGNHIFVLLQKLEGKAEQIRTLVVEHETKLSAEINQRKQMELRIASQVEEMETLATETLQLNETLKAVRKKHQGKKYGNIIAYYSYVKIRK